MPKKPATTAANPLVCFQLNPPFGSIQFTSIGLYVPRGEILCSYGALSHSRLGNGSTASIPPDINSTLENEYCVRFAFSLLFSISLIYSLSLSLSLLLSPSLS